MSRITEILTRVRDTLSDPTGDRYSDARLLRLLDEGQLQLIVEANLLREKIYRPLLIGIATYELPNNCYKPTRILVDGKPIDFISHEEMDEIANKGLLNTSTKDWESVEGSTIHYIVYDKQNSRHVKTYPIPNSQSESSFTLLAVDQYDSEAFDTYGVVAELLGIPTASSLGVLSEIEGTSPERTLIDPIYGIIVGGTGYTMESIYGIIISADDGEDSETWIENVNESIVNEYGFDVILDDEAQRMTIYYLRKPETIVDTNTEIEIDTIWDTALKHYIAGMALRDDRDSQNQQLGKDELALFAGYVNKAVKDSSQDFTAKRTQYDSPYISGF